MGLRRPMELSERFVSHMERWMVQISRIFKWIPRRVGVIGSSVAGFYMFKAHHRSVIGVLLSMAYGIKDYFWVKGAYGCAVAVILLIILTEMCLSSHENVGSPSH